MRDVAGFQHAMSYNTFAVLIVAAAIAHNRRRPPARDRRVVLSLRGILVFSGLYALALTGEGMFGAVTPIGELLFLVGCAGLAVFALGR